MVNTLCISYKNQRKIKLLAKTGKNKETQESFYISTENKNKNKLISPNLNTNKCLSMILLSKVVYIEEITNSSIKPHVVVYPWK